VDNDYIEEIRELDTQIAAMVEAEEDPHEIAELEKQVRVLRALYERACQLYEAGQEEADLRRRLALRGYGDWTLENVYAFVFETATDLPIHGQDSFVGEIRNLDLLSVLHQ
jgi:hypothetical protein